LRGSLQRFAWFLAAAVCVVPCSSGLRGSLHRNRGWNPGDIYKRTIIGIKSGIKSIGSFR
jgi:hypothetical protein